MGKNDEMLLMLLFVVCEGGMVEDDSFGGKRF